MGNRFWVVSLDGFQQVEQWGADPRVSFNEPSVEVCESQKALNILNGCRFFLFHDSRDLLRVHFDAALADNETEECGFGSAEFALRRFDIESRVV